MRKIKVNVDRFSESRGAFIQSYIVPVPDLEVVSIMNVLEYIYENLDSTLSFFYHAACRQAACGKCMVKLDGKIVLACKTAVETDEIHLSPYNQNIVRDLVCR